MQHPWEALWSEDEVSRLADNSVEGLIERFAIWESGEETAGPAARRRSLDHLRRAFDRAAAALDRQTAPEPYAGSQPEPEPARGEQPREGPTPQRPRPGRGPDRQLTVAHTESGWVRGQ